MIYCLLFAIDWAYQYLQDALDEAGSPDITGIAVANGTYYPDEDKDEGHSETSSESFTLSDGLGLYGGFDGTEDVFDFDMSTRNFVTKETILDGDIDDNNGTLDDGNSYNVVVGAAGATLDGFTITMGYADHASTPQHQSGGGMHNSGCSPAVANCIFDDNYALYGGGMSNNSSSSPTVTDCEFTNNAALVWGGGMDNYGSSSPTITNCLFSINEVTNDNSDDLGGGGIMCWSNCDATVVNCTFSQNTADNDSRGGGMYNKEASPTVTNCIFDDNYAEYGGGMFNDESPPAVTGCSFTDNEAYFGGGMFNDSASPTIKNCIFADNTARTADVGVAGAIFCYDYSDAAIENCTITQNTSHYVGGGIVADVYSDPQIKNSVVWDNDDFYADADIDAYGSSVITVSYSDYGVKYANGGTINVSNCISVDPLFADAGNDDFHLKAPAGRWNGSNWVTTDLVISPCIDTGDPSSVYSNEPTPNGSRINMGVYGNTSEASKSNKDIYVSTSGSDSTGNGTIGNPYATIQKGINMVADGGSVIVAGGLFNERFSFISGHKGFTLTTTGSSIIDGQDGGRVFSFSSVSSSITIENFTIQGGRVDNAGGGAYIYNSDNITFDDCDFEDNEAYNYSGQAYGGAVYIQDCDPAFDYCNFDNNQVYGSADEDHGGFGGAIFTYNASATFDHCEIGETGNAALNNSWSDEIYTYGSTVPTYTYCKIRGWDQDSPFVDGDYMGYSNSGPSGSNNSDF